jgi:hypothetical protein
MRGLDVRHGICAIAAATDEPLPIKSRHKNAEREFKVAIRWDDFIVSIEQGLHARCPGSLKTYVDAILPQKRQRQQKRTGDSYRASSNGIRLSANKKGRFLAPSGRCNFTLAVEAAGRLARVLTLR